MPEGSRRRTAAFPALLLVLCGLGAAAAPIALAVPGPGSECDAEAAPSGVDDPCREDGPGGRGPDLGLVALIGGAVLLGGAAALGTAFFALRRRAAPPLEPDPVDAQEWWACERCGRNNVVGSARCYACGAWQR